MSWRSSYEDLASHNKEEWVGIMANSSDGKKGVKCSYGVLSTESSKCHECLKGKKTSLKRVLSFQAQHLDEEFCQTIKDGCTDS